MRETYTDSVYDTGARTATPAVIPVFSSRGAAVLLIYVDVTAHAATPQVTPSVEAFDRKSGKWKAIWTAAAAITDVTGDITYIYAIGVGLLAAVPGGCTDVENVPVPETFRIKMTHGDTDSITYTVGLELQG